MKDIVDQVKSGQLTDFLKDLGISTIKSELIPFILSKAKAFIEYIITSNMKYLDHFL